MSYGTQEILVILILYEVEKLFRDIMIECNIDGQKLEQDVLKI